MNDKTMYTIAIVLYLLHTTTMWLEIVLEYEKESCEDDSDQDTNIHMFFYHSEQRAICMSLHYTKTFSFKRDSDNIVKKANCLQCFKTSSKIGSKIVGKKDISCAW